MPMETECDKRFVLFHEPEQGLSVNEIIRSFFQFLDEKFNPFILLLLSIIIFILVNVPYAFLLNLRNHSRPFNDGLVLPDVLHKMTENANIPSLNTAAKVIFFLILGTSFICFLLHQRRLIIFYRFLVIFSFLTILKMVVMIGTDMPDPSPNCLCYPSTAYSMSFGSALKALFDLDGCNNLMFSSFVSFTTLCTLFWSHYFNPFVGLVYWLVTFTEALLCIFARRSYTMDVIVSLLLTLTTFELTHIWFQKKQ